MSKDRFDILILTPLKEEAEALFDIFEFESDRSTDTMLRAVIKTGIADISALLVQPEGMGPRHAGNAADATLREFDFGLVVCLGIGGSISTDLKVGDVCYSDKIYDILENAKVKNRGKRGVELSFQPEHYSSPREIIASFEFLQTIPNRRPTYKKWQDDAYREAESLLTTVRADGQSTSIAAPYPSAISGAIACGAVSASDAYNLCVKEVNRKILVIETESGPVFEKAKIFGVPALTIRGISDSADAQKAALEMASSNLYRKIAVRNAATFLKMQLNNQGFRRFLASRSSNERVEGVIVSATETIDPIEQIIEEVTQDIDDRITEYCAEFRNRVAGYTLPIPRILKVEDVNIFSKAAIVQPVGIEVAIEEASNLLIKIPRNYPDPSLSWLIAREIIGRTWNGKILLPLVYDFETLKAPRGDFSKGEPGKIFERSKHIVELLPVIIIDSARLDSKSRVEYLSGLLISEMNCKSIILSRADETTVASVDLAKRIGVVEYKLCEVSFYEIMKFIQRYFDMDEAQAETTALKLRKAFAKFQLDAHPTYFAGISRDILWKILEANRRTELIGLAVSGFLSFVVAEDKNDISLSRSTRERFLRLLAVEINVNKVNFTNTSLCEFVEKFAEEHDFDINVRSFINGFVDNGILSDFDNRIVFSLHFIEKYLLAVELCSEPQIALRYFNVDSDEFDFSAFDIYSEIGPAKEFVRNIIVKLRERVTSLISKRAEKNVLLTSKVNPIIMFQLDRFHQIQAQVGNLSEDVRAGRGHAAEKQKLIDIADRAHQETTNTITRIELNNALNKERDAEQTDDDQLLFSVATYLVGSGAEYLHAKEKREMIRAISVLGSSIIDDMTKSYLEVRFAEIKKNILSNKTIEEFIESRKKSIDQGERTGNESKLTIVEARKFLDGFLDLVEFLILSIPFRQVSAFLCEHAQNKVLARTISKIEHDDLFDRLLQGIWLSDVNPVLGCIQIKNCLKELPDAPFLRLNLATHLLLRAYWSHWKKEDRLLLLDTAGLSLKPTAMNLASKGEIIRAITKDNKAQS